MVKNESIQLLRPGIKIWHETFGDKSDAPIVLMMGSGAQGICWHDWFCEELARKGRYVVRFDYRDTGLSTHFDFDLSPYNFFDLLEDLVGLLSILEIKRAHFVGLSMGGFLAQLFGIYYSEYILSLTLMMSTSRYDILLESIQGKVLTDDKKTEHSDLPPPHSAFIDAAKRINPALPVSQLLLENWKLENGPSADFDLRLWNDLSERCYKRDSFVLGHQNVHNHRRAALCTKPLNLIPQLNKNQCPVLVIEGQEDPVFPPPQADAIAKACRGQLFSIAKMGHLLNPQFYDKIIPAIIENTKDQRGQVSR